MTLEMKTENAPDLEHQKRPEVDDTPVLESQALFRGGSEVIIRHQGADYRMKITRQGKLILNK